MHALAATALTSALARSFAHAEAGVQALVRQGGISRLLPALQSGKQAVVAAALRSLDKLLQELGTRRSPVAEDKDVRAPPCRPQPATHSVAATDPYCS